MTGHYLQNIVSYSINWDDYKDIPNITLQESFFKTILKGNDRIYVIEKGGRIFESEINDAKNWKVAGDNNIDSVNQSSVVKYKDCLYFVSSKKVSKVAII
ncbi:unnamed protein product [Blepharisma stoltei]|uniref:Uncharacterized protein n=1 Tax=Blepharisma stoltei TaxID=1481888 RepID=A0AAU9IPS2_9CILI|nr:unnamed protein product [Blepharisma stoltei]